MEIPSSIEKWEGCLPEKKMENEVEEQQKKKKKQLFPFRSKKILSHTMNSVCDLEKSQTSDLMQSTPDRVADRYSKRSCLRSSSGIKKIAKNICVKDEKKEEAVLSICAEDDSVKKRRKRRKEIEMLPPKFQSLYDQFLSMWSTLWLLRRKNYAPTFQNMRASIETLTGRSFSYKHLAQLKHILPEVIQLEKILVFDEKTCCRKPEIVIRVTPNAIERNNAKVTADSISFLRMEVYSRLSALCKSMKEDDDIPEEILPEPFNQNDCPTMQKTVFSRVQMKLLKTNKSSNFEATKESSSGSTIMPVSGSFTSSFRKRFSNKVVIPESEKTQLLCLSTSSTTSGESSSVGSSYGMSWPIILSPEKLQHSPLEPLNRSLSRFASSEYPTAPRKASDLPALPSTPDAPTKTKMCSDPSAHERDSPSVGIATPHESTPSRLMSNTPQIQTPKRPRFTPQNASLVCHTTGKLLMPPKKKLDFLSAMNANDRKSEARLSADDESIISALSPSLLQSMEAKALEKMDDDSNNIAVELRKKRMGELPKLFDILLLIFQSANWAVMTKQHLLYQIIVQSHVSGRLEISARLNLLQELLPDWISCKKALSGDLMYCIRKCSDPMLLRARLVEAAG